MLPPKPDIQKGDKVQLVQCPKSNWHSHSARVTGEWDLFKDGWCAPVRFNCYGTETAVVNFNNMVLIKKGFRNMGENTPWYATAKAINGFIIAGVAIVLFLIISGAFASISNTYVQKQEQVSTARSNNSKEEQRRIDLFNNLADAVKSGKNFEKDTLTQIAQARSQANRGNVDQAMLTIASVVEAYPEVKSTKLYEQAMLEFSATENRLAQYRESYNNDARDYNNFIRGFWESMFLGLMGKDKTPAPYLDFKTNNAEARNLFKE